MTTAQQLKDQFDRTADGLPEPDVAAAVAAGRRGRRRRATSYAVGSLAVLAVASAVVVPRLGGSEEVPVTSTPAADGTFVAGTTIDTDLAAAVAAAAPALPAPTDVYPSDWSRDTPLPDEDFADATEWQLLYDLPGGETLLVYLSKPVPGVEVRTGPSRQEVGDPPRHQFLVVSEAADGLVVNVIETVPGDTWKQVERARRLTDDQLGAIAAGPGLDFPDPVDPPPAP
jgi:hypothetical protein